MKILMEMLLGKHMHVLSPFNYFAIRSHHRSSLSENI
jgi:hypothetical protein